MIHYHGGPFNSDEVALKAWRGRHAFVSFAHPEQVAIAAEICQSFALDNGAFSFWKSGKEVDWDEYYSWVDQWIRHPGFDWAVIPDVVEGAAAENDSLMRTWPFEKHYGVPVWHLHEPLSRLEYLVKEWPRVAFGSSGDYSEPRSVRWWERMVEAMGKVCNSSGQPVVKLHGLRMLSPQIYSVFPFSSADSTTAAINTGFDKNWPLGFDRVGKPTKALVLIDKIENHQSASVWNGGVPRMEGFFE